MRSKVGYENGARFAVSCNHIAMHDRSSVTYSILLLLCPSIAMRNVSICFYVSQQHVECFQIADKRCKIKQQLCHSASPATQPVSYSRLQQQQQPEQQQQTIQNDRQNPRTTTNFGVFEQRLVHGVMGTNFSHSARASVLQSSL